MSISIGELRGVISLNDQFSGPLDKVAKALGVSSKSLTAVAQFAGGAVAAIASTTAAITLLGVQGGKVASMEAAFKALSGSVGETGSAMLAASQGATKGLISDFDLMAASNKAVLLGLPVTAQSMGTLAQSAVVLGRAMGQDAGKSLDDLTTALGRSSPLILDNLGLTVKVGQANEAYAAKIGKSAAALTEGEKKTAFYNAAMEAATKKVAELGGIHLTFADRVQQGRVMVGNFVDSLGVAIATSPVVAAGMDSIMKALQGAFGSNSQDTVKVLMGFVNQFAIFLVDAAVVAVGAGRQISNIWNGLKVLFNEVVGFQIDLLGKLVTSFGSLVEAATFIPGVGEKFKGIEGSIKGIGTDLTNLGQGFHENAQAAIDSAADQNAAFDSVQAVLSKTREAMVAAQGATIEMASAATTVKPALEEAGAAAGYTAEQIAAMEEASRKSGMAIQEVNDQIREKFVSLQDELTLANLTGLEQRLAEIEINREKEIAGMQEFAFANMAQYEVLVAMVNEKYSIMAASARSATVDISAAFSDAATSTGASLQQTADAAVALYNSMLVSGMFTAQQLEEAWKKAEEAKLKVAQESAQGIMSTNQALTQGAIQLFGALGEKFKVAAIAGAIIATYSAVAKALASAPWPANLVLAAGALAAGMANVAKIRSSQAGFAEGTRGMGFEEFGSGTSVTLHGKEAVINQEQGKTLADMVEGAALARDAKLTDIMSENTSHLRALRDDLARERRLQPIMLKNLVALARA